MEVRRTRAVCMLPIWNDTVDAVAHQFLLPSSCSVSKTWPWVHRTRAIISTIVVAVYELGQRTQTPQKPNEENQQIVDVMKWASHMGI